MHHFVVADELSPNYEKHQILEDVSAGKWAVRGTSDGQELVGEIQGKWAPGKYCVVYSGYVHPVGGTAKTHITGTIGWDNETGKIKQLILFSDGSSGTALFDVKERTLVGKRCGVKPDGAKYSQDLTFSIGKDRWVGHPTDDVDDTGKVLTQHGEFVFTRIVND